MSPGPRELLLAPSPATAWIRRGVNKGKRAVRRGVDKGKRAVEKGKRVIKRGRQKAKWVFGTLRKGMNYGRFRSLAFGGLEAPISIFCGVLAYRHEMIPTPSNFHALDPEVKEFPDTRFSTLVHCIIALLTFDLLGALIYQRTADAIMHHCAALCMILLIWWNEVYSRCILMAMDMILGPAFGCVRLAWLFKLPKFHKFSNWACLLIMLLFRLPLHFGYMYMVAGWVRIYIQRDGLFTKLPWIGAILVTSAGSLIIVDLIYWVPWAWRSLTGVDMESKIKSKKVAETRSSARKKAGKQE